MLTRYYSTSRMQQSFWQHHAVGRLLRAGNARPTTDAIEGRSVRLDPFGLKPGAMRSDGQHDVVTSGMIIRRMRQ